MSAYTTIERLQREITELRDGLGHKGEAYEILRKALTREKAERRGAVERFQDCYRFSPRHPSLDIQVFGAPLSMVKRKEVKVEGFEGRKKRRLDGITVPAVEGRWRVGYMGDVGREEVGTRIDPEKRRMLGGGDLPVIVKVGCVQWADGLEGVKRALQGTGFVSCDGSRWLVSKAERERRLLAGRKASTILLMVRGVGSANTLCKEGLWVGGYWCSVKRFVAIPPRRKEGGWVRRFEEVAEGLKGVHEGLIRVEGKKVTPRKKHLERKVLENLVSGRCMKKMAEAADAGVEYRD
ncbi:hypothetical protein HOY82DRAFT_616818 [Tuber indicum]|nr:hypothetical protein HOY82DRAFT_616818 [Tuber indicum]